ncbi:hypothetical protein [Zoogloea sp.]|uniref:hypothetical protein n=1 Tax=Zoogloea sp. TaxID=49181 RepID=UPI0035B3C55A
MEHEFSDDDMAAVGRALMAAISAHAPPGWHPAQCPTEIVGDLRTQCDELIAERDALSAKLAELEGQEPVEIDWPEYHHEGMGCGLEDRDITDRYEAMRHGWDCALDRVAEVMPDKIYIRPIPAHTILQPSPLGD